jgi:adenine-specific DNA-methyltransferase
LCYAKNKDLWQRNLIPREGESIYRNPDNDPKGPWKLDRIYANNPYNADYKIKNPLTGEVFSRPQGKFWRYSEETISRYLSSGQLIFTEKLGAYPNVKRYLSEVQDGLVPTTIFDRDFAGDNGLASRELSSLLESEKVMDYPKPTKLLKRILQIGSNPGDLVLDFFAGSGSMGDAVMQLNSEDAGNRRFILCQIPEKISASSDAARFGTIAEITKERLRRAANKILDSDKDHEPFDSGFRVLRVESSNFTEVYYYPDFSDKSQLDLLIENVKSDRTSEDLLFQVMLDSGIDLALPISKYTIQNKEVFLVDGNALACCFDGSGGVDEDFVKELAKAQPLRAVFRDAGFKDSSMKINVEQIFKLLSPITDVKCI